MATITQLLLNDQCNYFYDILNKGIVEIIAREAHLIKLA